MKKKIVILTSVVLVSFLAVYASFLINRKGLIRNEIKDYIENGFETFIYQNGQYENLSDEQIEKLEFVQSGELTKEQVVNDRNKLKEKVKLLNEKLLEITISPVRSIKENEIVQFGQNKSNSSDYFYIYKDGSAVLSMNNKYYVYKLNIEELNKIFDDFKLEGDPYYTINQGVQNENN